MATKKERLTAAEVLSALKLVKNKSSTGYASMPDTIIAFNAKFLKDSLSIFKEDSIKMYSDGRNTHAGIFTNGVDEFLLMPLMLHQ